MRAGRMLRRLVADRIEAAVPELSGRVYDKATASALHPYVTLGPSSWSEANSDCFDAREHSLQIDLWHSGTNKGALEDLTDDVASALRGFADEDRMTMHPIEVTLVRVIDDPSGDVHGIVQVLVYLEG